MPLPTGFSWTQPVADYSNKKQLEPSREQMQSDKQETDQLFSEWDWQNPDALGPQGQALPELATGWQPNGNADFGTGFSGWWKKAYSNVRQSWQTGYQEGLKISGLTEFAVKKAQGEEEGQATLDAMKEARKPKDQNAAYWTAATEATKEIFDQALWGLLDGLSQPAIKAEQAIGSVGLAIDDTIAGRDVNWKRNFDASRMAYSGMFDATVTQEMYRRIDAGVRPDLAAQEVMIANPSTMWPELIGQILLDPLNVVTIWGKAGQAAKIQKNVAKTFHEVANPAVAKLFDDVADVAKLDEAAAYEKTKEIVTSQQGLLAVSGHAEDVAKAGEKMDTYSKSYQVGQLTSTGKAAHIANQTGEIMMHVVNNSGADEAMEFFDGMVKSTNADPTIAADGVATMLRFPDAKALFSEAGNNTTVMLSKMMAKHGDGWLDNLAKLKDNPAELTKDLLTKLDEVGEEMFPSASSMLKAEDEIRAGKVLTDTAAIAERAALAERAAQLPASVRAATKFHDAAQTVVGPVNKFFIGAYMGWSPGYAFRNFSNNSLQLLVDYGPGMLLGKSDDMFAKASKLHGGDLWGVSDDTQEASLFKKKGSAVSSLEGSQRGTGVKDIISGVKDKGLKGPVLGMSQRLEANAAKRIIAKTYTKTFEKGTKAMVKALTPDLKAAGFPDDIINRLPTYIMQNDGDAVKIIDAIRADVSSGVIDMFNDIDRIDPKYKGFLSDAGKWDEYAETVLRAPTREAATTAAQKIFDEIAQAGDYAYREGRPVVDQADKFLKMAEKGGLSEQRGQLISLRKTESRKAIQAAEAILAEADDLANQVSAATGVPIPTGQLKTAHGITGLNTWGNDAAKEADRLQEIAWKLTNDTRKGGANLNQLWTQYPELFQGTPPVVLDVKSFRDALWSAYDQAVGKTWAGARDTAIDNVTGYLDDLKKAGAEVNEQWYESIKVAQEGAQQYDNAMVGRFGELVEETPMPYGSRTTQISQIAAKHGIETATPGGIPTDKKTLATINKYAEVKYNSLEDVPIQVAEEAFAKKAGKATKAAGQLDLKASDITMSEATQIPRGELPPEVSARFEQEANRLIDELNSGTGPQVTVPKQGAGSDYVSTPSTNVDWYKELPKNLQNKKVLNAALEKIIKDKGADKGVNVERVKEMIIDRFRYGSDGAPPDLKVLQGLGADQKTLQSALDDYNDFTKQELTLEQVLGKADEVDPKNLVPIPEDVAYYDDAGNFVEPNRKRILPPPSEGEAIPISRAIHEQMEDVTKMRAWVMDDITKNFGKKQVVDKVAESALKKAEKEMTQKLAENRLISSRVAQANRDFTLLNYGEKSYWDTALAYLYPFHFWYKGTYKNWFSRIASNPAILGHYARYKQILGTVHADMPEWWKYNINTNDLPGVDVENPLYFNLEATLWPLNGLTNTDFNDPSKRVNWWTYGLDFANKFGPSTWSPLNMVTGLSLYAKGEKEAGEKWMGRLIPQSATVKAGASLLGIANLETDPFVKFLQGGLDPYERRRAQRALATMMDDAEKGNSEYSPEQIQDAAYSQEGEIWEEAVKRAVNGRAPSQISSFLFGVGFKGRTEQDIEIDRFYGDYNKIWTMRPNLTEQEFKEGMDSLKDKYPFMDTVLLSRRDDVERDAGLAYLVLGRIPPGKSTEIAEAVGIDSAMFDKFFSDKGQIDRWNEADRKKFMSGILNISAVLEIPSDMTREEWTAAKGAYKTAMTEAEKAFGKDIWDMVDGYYAAKTKGYDQADAYLEQHPEVQDALDWKAERVMNSPLLSAYYGGANVIESYYRSQMYADIEKNLGADIFDVMDEYNDLKTFGEGNESKTFYNKHKAQIKQYYKIKDAWAIEINQNVAQMTNHIPEGQGLSIREDVDYTNLGAQQLAGSLQEPQQPSVDELRSIIPPRLWSLTEDYFLDSKPLPESARRQLERLASEMGYYSVDDLLQAVGSSLYAQSGQ